MAYRLPIEIWTKILEEIVGVPEFFSTDPLTAYGAYSWSKFRLEGFYWRSERWRNALRRVHSTWNAILSQPRYQYRFVRMNDVTHERLKEEDIPWERTLRIAFGAEPGCFCQKYPGRRRPRKRGEAKLKMCSKTLEAMARIVARYGQGMEGDQKWALRIVDIGLKRIDLSELLQVLSKVSSFTAVKGATTWATTAFHADNLRLLHIDFDTNSRPNSISALLSFPHLTTLIIHLDYEKFDCERLHVPSLRHLFIRGLNTHQYQVAVGELVKIMSVVGRNLRTFHCDAIFLSGEIPSGFWQLAPNLTQIRLGCNWMHPPPRTHPLQSIRVQGGYIWAHLHGSRPAESMIFRGMPGWVIWSTSTPMLVGPDHGVLLEEWAGRSLHIAMTGIWERIFFDSPFRELCLYFSREYETLGWTFTDSTGWTFNMFLVSLLERRRVARTARVREWIPSKCPRPAPMYAEGILNPQNERIGDDERDILESELYAVEYF